MLQEKILAVRCKHYVVIIDESKLTDNIGGLAAVPVEVIPEALSVAEQGLLRAGAASVTLRKALAKHGPVITEAGNLVLDAQFDDVPDELENRIKCIVGVVESGLFLSQAHELLIGGSAGVRRISRK
jgi:ribose 5-phosphate isomerase A